MENNLNKNSFNNNKPKYKYELKIIHDSLNEKNKLKSKPKSMSPDSIISSINFKILNKSQNQSIKYKEGKINRFYEHYDDFNNYKFYESKSRGASKSERPFLKKEPQPSNQINISSIKNEKYKIKNNNYNNVDNNRIACKREDNNDIFTFRERNRNNNSVINNKIGEYDYDEKNEINAKKILCKSTSINIGRKYKNFNHYSINQIKKYFNEKLQVEKVIERSFYPQKRGISLSSLRISNNNNCLYYETSYLTKNKINSFIKNIINNKKLDINKYLYIKKKLNKKKLKKGKNNNNCQISQKQFSISKYYSKQNNIIQYIDNKMYTPQKKSHQSDINNFLNNNNNSPKLKTDLNNNLKTSESSGKIKNFYLGKKIDPLMIIKTTPDSKNKKENKVIINEIKYSLLSTSLDTKPIIDLFKNNTLEEKAPNLYILIPEIKEDKISLKQLRPIKYSDDINKGKKSQIRKERNKFIFKNKVFNNGNNNKNTNNISVIKSNSNTEPIEINDDIYMKKIIDNIYNFNNYCNLLNNINEKNANNNSINIDEKIEYIKYLYNSDFDLDSFNQEKLENYFLKLSDEEKIAVLTNLNNGDIKNKKIYKALINILKEKRLKRTNSIKEINRNIHEIIANNVNEEIKKKRNNSSIILFKKKTYLQ